MNSHVRRSWSALLVCTVCLSAFGAGNTVDTGWAQLPHILKHIKTPHFPDRDFDITQFGAIADGKTPCTDAIKKAITQCHEAGGGRVLVPGEGTYYTGPIHLKSNVHLEVAKGATLLFSDNFLYGEKDTGKFTPTVRNINLENVTCGKSKYGLRIDAYERSPVSGLHFKNCSFMNVKEGNILNHVKGLTWDHVTINGKSMDDNAEEGAGPRPNILLIMADDMGYSDIGCFGGEIQTPNLDQLAANGMRFTQFYNCAKCNPTRATLLTGQYNQAVGTANMQFGATFAEVLRPAGYRTLIAGKWHQSPLPTTRGFDRYFGLADGCCNYFNPGIEARPGEGKPGRKLKNGARRWAIEGRAIMGYTNSDKDFYTTDAFTDYAIDRLEEYKDEGKPFLLYLPYTAPHYPLHAWPEDIAKYRGKYKIGWDRLRQTRYKRMAQMGIIDPRIARLSERDTAVPAWDTLTDAQKDAQDLKMAVYAAMINRLDQNIGRVIAKLKELGKFDNTLILFLSDNGGCAENVNTTPNIAPGPVESYRTVGPSWANASNTPYRKFKSTDFEGGNCTPFIAHWPKVIKPGQITEQSGHIIDIMPTFMELAHAAYPSELDGRSIKPLSGTSLVPIFKGETRDPHSALYWQYGRAAAIRMRDFKLVRLGKASAWELYDLSSDRTETDNLAARFPERVAEMKQAWDTWWKQSKAVE